MKNYLLFVDLETSDKPQSLKHPVSDVTAWPHILQLSWQVFDYSGNQLKSEDHYVFDASVEIHKDSQKIHGLTQETLSKIGETAKDVMRRFSQDLRHYKPTIIGHFVEFDSKMLQVSMFRAGLKNIVKDYLHYCTMTNSIEYVVSPQQTYPKLEELYFRLFSEQMENMHNAHSDVEATAKIFFEMVRRKEIDPENLEPTTFNKLNSSIKNKMGCGLPVLAVLIITLWILL